MNMIAWMLSLGLLIWLMAEAVAFHRATVCRQVVWLKSTELRTRALLHEPRSSEKAWHISCQLRIIRDETSITWQRLPNLNRHQFELELEGSL